MKILSNASVKKKTKRLKSFRFSTFIGSSDSMKIKGLNAAGRFGFLFVFVLMTNKQTKTTTNQAISVLMH